MDFRSPRTFPAWLCAAGLALCAASAAAAGPGPMQVEEPQPGESRPPIRPEEEQASWKDRKSAGLTPAQKEALRNRRETMEDMILLIRQKRCALREARPEDRQALARELHTLILEKAEEAERGRDHEKLKAASRNAGRGGPDADAPDKSARVREIPDGSAEQTDRQLEHLEEIQRQQELRRELLEEKLKQQEKQQENRSNGNGNGKGNGNSK